MADPSERQRRVLGELETASPDAAIKEIRWDREFQSPKFISGTLSAVSQDDPETIARRFLDQTANLVALPDQVEERMELSNIVTDAQDYKHVTFQQVLNGVLVFEGSVQVHINPRGQVVGYKANRMTQVDVATTLTVPDSRALEIAREDLGESDSQKIPAGVQLVLFPGDGGRLHLAWHVQLFSDHDVAMYHYFVDAHSGTLLYRYNDLRHVMSRETYTADSQEVLPGQLIIREEDASHPDQVAWDAHANAGTVYQYYRDRFGRNSYDDRGSILRSTVHFSQRFNNAFWQPSLMQMVYGDGDGVQFTPLGGATDIVAHELTHAVTSSTARFVYAEEAGALDESFADFFAIMVTNGDPVTDWRLGEHVYTPGRPGDALRDVADPPGFGQPDHADNQRRLQPGELPQCNPRAPGYNDNGYVHTNSGIPNKAGYLMVAGGTHHGVTVEPLGKTVAEQIMYLALTVYLESASQSRWTFRQARLATMDACQQLFPGDEAKLASVQNAWAAVGVGEPAEPPSPTPPIPEPEPEPAPVPNQEPGWLKRILRWLIRVLMRIVGRG